MDVMEGKEIWATRATRATGRQRAIPLPYEI